MQKGCYLNRQSGPSPETAAYDENEKENKKRLKARLLYTGDNAVFYCMVSHPGSLFLWSGSDNRSELCKHIGCIFHRSNNDLLA